MSHPYPSCDFCGSCEHCPTHEAEVCIHPCVGCGESISFDQPGCFSDACMQAIEDSDPYQFIDYYA